MAIDIAGFITYLKDHAVEHGFHVHDERHFIETFSLRQSWEVDLHPESACDGPLDLNVAFDVDPRVLLKELDDITAGKRDWQEVLERFWRDFTAAIAETSELRITDVLEKINEVLEPHLFPPTPDGTDPRLCPNCGQSHDAAAKACPACGVAREPAAMLPGAASEWARARDGLKTNWAASAIAFWVSVVIMGFVFFAARPLNLTLASIAFGTLVIGSRF